MFYKRPGDVPRYPELERLICAALSNQRLAAQLLRTPEDALDILAHACHLSPDERAIVVSIAGAQDIHEFAARLYAKVHQHGDLVGHPSTLLTSCDA